MDRNDGSSESSMTAGSNPDASGTSGNTASGSASSQSGDGASASGGFSDRARDLAGSAKDRLADVGATARERATHLRGTVADALESSADKLRQRAGSGDGQLSGATSGGSVAVGHETKMTNAASRVAGGMDATAEWIRDIDIDGLKVGIERQVKEHPGRTLLIAVGLGYLIGKAFRR
ncbi:MAG TPA: hypothetical protein VH559_15200 [Gemmatimonadaceae bacterium]|jgi:hypothetical protein